MRCVQAVSDGVYLQVKVVPGARRERVAGHLGGRLKVQVSAVPEDGKANRGLCELLARELKLAVRQVQVIEGHHRPLKTVHVTGVTVEQVTVWLQGV